MNTITFNVLMVIFSILYLLYFTFLGQLRKNDAYRRMPKTGVGRWAAKIILGLVAVIIITVFVCAPEVKYRVTILCLMIVPVAITHLRSSPIGIRIEKAGGSSHLTDMSVEKMKRGCKVNGVVACLLYTGLVSLAIIYLK